MDVPLDAVPPLDASRIADLRALDAAGGPGLFFRLITIFATRGRELLAELRAAAEIGDHAAIAAAAHELKGSAGTIGAYLVSEQSGVIEHAAQHREDLPTALLDSLDVELSRAYDALIALEP